MSILKHHAKIETNVVLLMVGILLTVIIGGIVEIVPLFTITETIEKVDGMRPYSPLEQEGRNIYVREGCYLCHSQMIRPFRDEVERYGHYSLAAESMYDHPFQWGSKRNGPDLARVGGKYTNEWHVRHLANPRDVVPESIMPGYKHLHRPLDYDDVVANMKTLRVVGVPYSAGHAGRLLDHAVRRHPLGKGEHDGSNDQHSAFRLERVGNGVLLWNRPVGLLAEAQDDDRIPRMDPAQG
jgi:cytochrome c oxidase cbb3-type subunit 2